MTEKAIQTATPAPIRRGERAHEIARRSSARCCVGTRQERSRVNMRFGGALTGDSRSPIRDDGGPMKSGLARRPAELPSASGLEFLGM